MNNNNPINERLINFIKFSHLNANPFINSNLYFNLFFLLIDNLNNSYLNKFIDNDKICPICLSKANIPCNLDNCSHIFCFRCITKWSKLSFKCPCCRKNFKKIYIIDY